MRGRGSDVPQSEECQPAPSIGNQLRGGPICRGRPRVPVRSFAAAPPRARIAIGGPAGCSSRRCVRAQHGAVQAAALDVAATSQCRSRHRLERAERRLAQGDATELVRRPVRRAGPGLTCRHDGGVRVWLDLVDIERDIQYVDQVAGPDALGADVLAPGPTGARSTRTPRRGRIDARRASRHRRGRAARPAEWLLALHPLPAGPGLRCSVEKPPCVSDGPAITWRATSHSTRLSRQIERPRRVNLLSSAVSLARRRL